MELADFNWISSELLVEKFIATTAILNENWLIRRSYPHFGKCKMRVILTFFLTHSPRLLYSSEKLQSTFLLKYFFWIVWWTAIPRKIFWENFENQVRKDQKLWNFFKNHAEYKAKKLVSDLLFLKTNRLYEVKASGLQLSFKMFW